MKAQMSSRGDSWCLYVVLWGTASRWPERCWGSGAAIPTPVQRAEALRELGYEVAPGATWEWYEINAVPGDPSSPVELIAHIRVQSTPSSDRGAA
ncbi:DUF6303 family protein [Streptomyces silvisoli]|uniref:DUF6303 family protein n=1 Tax=Streptomyces silvisoli TaxID=3034235 RepID=A0ABT5ZEX9_9ACTN|nr:DUF6303 family protein [Streptomyces silvisoli]MDF3288362.1 DUF6303 family protein [Streptomyces silvisoli]